MKFLIELKKNLLMMKYPIIDLSSKIFTKRHLAIRWIATLTLWIVAIILVIEPITTTQVKAHHYGQSN